MKNNKYQVHHPVWMPERYICSECSEIKKAGGSCDNCKAELTRVEEPYDLRYILPYILGGVAAVMILLAFVTQYYILVWINFPTIVLALLVDHINQKKLDRKARDKIK